MFYPTIKLPELVNKYSSIQHFHFNIVQIGTGGNGGYLVQRLSKLLYSLNQKDTNFRYTYKLIDGDQIELKNLQRQPFIDEDLDKPKAQVLAERYENAYDIPIFYKNSYAESSEDIEKMFYIESVWPNIQIPILLGCVDNNATRKLMHETFLNMNTIIYLDSGIDSVDEEGSIDSGYSGQVVCGLKLNDKKYLSPVGEVYTNILEDKDTRLPTQACGEQVVNYPQRMQTNELAALVMNGYLNTILSDKEIVSHYTNFNARKMLVRPTYIKEEVNNL